MRKYMPLLGFILLAFLPAVTGTMFPPDAWYASLHKPTWNPPNGLFAPIWTILYLTIGTSAWLVFRKAGGWKPVLFEAYLLQLVLNALWMPMFFGLHAPMSALLVIVAMWVAILWTIQRFSSVSTGAAALLIPYFAWVSFATVLNGWIAFNN